MGKIALVIILKSQFKLFLKTFIISALCCALFIAVGLFYLNLKLEKPTENTVSQEPYAYSPQNAGLLFEISGERVLIYLNFEESYTAVILSETLNGEESEIYGYSIDYTVEGDYDLLSGIIDKVGGIELKMGEEELVYTGVQVVEMLAKTSDRENLRKEIIKNIFKKIAQNGFLRQDFLYITENSNTNLTVPKFYYWQDYISQTSKTVRILE